MRDRQRLQLAAQPRRRAPACRPACAVRRLVGRYHLAPSSTGDARVALHRRIAGGRVIPHGEGFAAVALTVPHRSALVADSRSPCGRNRH
jgi:hypothetical protein